MKLDNYYYLEYSNYWPHLCHTHNVLADISFDLLQVFREKSRTEPFIWTRRVDCSNSVNHNWVQVLSIPCYYYPLLGLNLQPPDDFIQKHFPTKRLIHCAMWTIQSEFWGLINLVSPSTHEILSYRMFLYLSSYCNFFFFFFNWIFLNNGSQLNH